MTDVEFLSRNAEALLPSAEAEGSHQRAGPLLRFWKGAGYL